MESTDVHICVQYRVTRAWLEHHSKHRSSIQSEYFNSLIRFMILEIVNGGQFGPYLGRHEHLVVFVSLFIFRLLWARFAIFENRRWFSTGPWLLFILKKRFTPRIVKIVSLTEKFKPQYLNLLIL